MAKRKAPRTAPETETAEDAFPLVGDRFHSRQDRLAVREKVKRSKAAVQEAAAQLIVAECLSHGMPPAEAVAQAVRWATRQDPPLPAEEAERIAREALARPAPDPAPPQPPRPRAGRRPPGRFGFPAGWWLPEALAAEWQGREYPRELSGESVAQWLRLRKDCARGAEEAGGLEFPWVARRLREETAADCRLIDEHLTATLPATPAARRRPLEIARHVVRKFRGLPSATHSADFRSVYWYGANYQFTESQAPVVQALWEAWEAETPDLGNWTLLNVAKSQTSRLVDVFRKGAGYHPAW